MSAPLTFDRTVPTWDSTGVTWDATEWTGIATAPVLSVPAGTIDLEVGGVLLRYTPATARAAVAEADRTQFRPPFGPTWFVDGIGPLPAPEYRITAEVHAASLAEATEARNELQARMQYASALLTPYGWVIAHGLMSFASTPLEDGYRCDAVIIGDAPTLPPIQAFVIGTTGATSDYVTTLLTAAGVHVERVSVEDALARASEVEVVVAPGLYDTSLYSIDAPLVCANDTTGRLVTLGLFTGTPSSNVVSLSSGLEAVGTHPILDGLTGTLGLAADPSLGFATQQDDQLATSATAYTRSRTNSARLAHVAGIATSGYRAATITVATLSGVVDSTATNDGLITRAAQWAAGRLPFS